MGVVIVSVAVMALLAVACAEIAIYRGEAQYWRTSSQRWEKRFHELGRAISTADEGE